MIGVRINLISNFFDLILGFILEGCLFLIVSYDMKKLKKMKKVIDKELPTDCSAVGKLLDDALCDLPNQLESFLDSNNIRLNFREIYLGGGSPTYYKEEEFKNLIKRLKNLISFENLDDFTIEIDPIRVDEEKLEFYHEQVVNRLSFGIQDFDKEIGKIVNRINSVEDIKNLLSQETRNILYNNKD